MVYGSHIKNFLIPSYIHHHIHSMQVNESEDKVICGVIKQNQSEVGNIPFSVSYWIVTSICKATFCRKPH